MIAADVEPIVGVILAIASVGGVGGFVLSVFVFRETQRQNRLKAAMERDQADVAVKVDVITASQSSLAAALARADTDICGLRKRVDAADRRADEIEERERQCQEMLRKLQQQLGDQA